MPNKPDGFGRFDNLMKKLVKVPPESVTPKITIRCPTCKREKIVDRHDMDPDGSVLCVMYCPKCCAGKGFKTCIVGYFDDSGNEIV